MSNNYIVYVARGAEGECLYVGEGLPERWKHIISGTSHVYLANKHHFEGGFINVEVVRDDLSKDEARKLEAELIETLDPAWNKRGLRVCADKNVESFLVKRFLEEFRGSAYSPMSNSIKWTMDYLKTQFKPRDGSETIALERIGYILNCLNFKGEALGTSAEFTKLCNGKRFISQWYGVGKRLHNIFDMERIPATNYEDYKMRIKVKLKDYDPNTKYTPNQ